MLPSEFILKTGSVKALLVGPRHHCAVALGKLLTPVVCAYVTKQYNMVPA